MRKSSPKPAAPQAPGSHMQHIDAIGNKLHVAAAIVDCAVILAALQAMPAISRGEHSAGQGMAGGYEGNPDSLPVLLSHSGSLIREAMQAANDWHSWSRAISGPPELRVVGVSHGR